MSARLSAWRGYLTLLESIDHSTTSATGWEFIRGAMPARPVRVERDGWACATRVTWSDGSIEDIDDVDQR